MNLNIPGFSTPTLLEFHSIVKVCLQKDDADATLEKPYGVRAFADWRILSDAIEQQLLFRNVSFSPITWDESPPTA
jgi:hypothetical protein